MQIMRIHTFLYDENVILNLSLISLFFRDYESFFLSANNNKLSKFILTIVNR